MPVQRATTDRRTIEQWAKHHNATPAELPPARHDSEPAMLSFLMPGQERGELLDISWDQFFAVFQLQDLAFVYSENTSREPAGSEYELVHNRTKSAGPGLQQAPPEVP